MPPAPMLDHDATGGSAPLVLRQVIAAAGFGGRGSTVAAARATVSRAPPPRNTKEVTMTRLTMPMSAMATRREPILICYDDSPDAVRAIEAAASLLDPVLVVPPPR